MVKFRGIEISMVSQFDAVKLPEYSVKDCSKFSTIEPSESCDVSVYTLAHRGSQFWFEYKVDGPHPPKAVYFFKMTYNNKIITSWDTTQKQGFEGKTMMALRYLGTDPFTGESVVQRNVFQFSDKLEQANQVNDDCIEISVHRVEHRRRISLESSTGAKSTPRGDGQSDNMNLRNGGLLTASAPRRYYKYQLLDPTDSPHARFHFFFRTADTLREYGISSSPESVSGITSSESGFSTDWTEDATDASRRSSSDSTRDIQATETDVKSNEAEKDTHTIDGERSEKASDNGLVSENPNTFNKQSEVHPPRLGIETTPRNPSPVKGLGAFLRSPLAPSFLKAKDSNKSSSAERKPPIRPAPIIICLDGVDFDLSKEKRPLSPFNSAGILRKKAVTPPPPTAPPSVTTFTIDDEIAEMEALAQTKLTENKLQKKKFESTTRGTRAHAAQKLGGLFERAICRKEKRVTVQAL